MTNIAYDPEKFGLIQVGFIDYNYIPYSFDERIFWYSETEGLFTYRDSGCSCPIPFEDIRSIHDLERVNVKELDREIRECSLKGELEDNLRLLRDLKRKYLD